MNPFSKLRKKPPEMKISDYEIEHILQGFQSHMHDDLQKLFADKKIRRKINKELRKLQKLGKLRKKEIAEEESEINQLLSILKKGNVSQAELTHLKKTLLATLRNFTAVLTKVISFYEDEDERKNDITLASRMNSIINFLQAWDIKKDRDESHTIGTFIELLEEIKKLLNYEFKTAFGKPAGKNNH